MFQAYGMDMSCTRWHHGAKYQRVVTSVTSFAWAPIFNSVTCLLAMYVESASADATEEPAWLLHGLTFAFVPFCPY